MMPARLPTELKRLRGTLRASRVNAREPRHPVAVVRPSRELSADVQREFDLLRERVMALRVCTAGDGLALEIAASSAAEFWRMSAVIAALGATYETTTPQGSVMLRPRPEVALAADAWRRYAAMLQHFGLTPVSRARVEAIRTAAPASKKWAGMLPEPPGA